MKIVCGINIVRRANRDLKSRFIKSTLTIGKKIDKSKLCIIDEKNNIKYDLTNNIVNIFRKFADEGKCTISIKEPEIDLQIKADPIQLKAFLNVIKNELFPDKESSGKKTNTNIRAFGSTKMLLDKVIKMTIKERSALTKGLPRTLRELHINEIGCLQMPIGILNLTNLSILDLSKNNITKLHRSLGNLKLTQVILNDNQLGQSIRQKDWDWLEGDNIRRSLHVLIISRNGLKNLPSSIFNCSEIRFLDMSWNEITRIPFAIKQLKYLRLFNISHNALISLPYSIVKTRFDLIDLSANQFPHQKEINRIILYMHRELSRQQYRAPSLLELSARTVIKHQLHYMIQNVPQILKDVLSNSPLCVSCGVICFDLPVFRNITLIQLRCKEKITSDNASNFPADGPFCSRSCQDLVGLKFSVNLI